MPLKKQKTIKVVIEKNGEVEYETQGFTGAACKKELAELDKQGIVIQTQATPEAYGKKQELPDRIKVGNA